LRIGAGRSILFLLTAFADKIGVHDFLLAKEIIDEVLKITREKKLGRIKSISVEVGGVSLAHDGFDEHMEDISVENLYFGLENIAKNTLLKDAKFIIKKVRGDNWKITRIEVE
jgi:Zn finger protein HypA/HybF involved in hydrogenase expression